MIRQKLQFPLKWDEHHYWDTTLYFSKNLIPSVEQLRGYNELNTPLPFLVFGYLEYFFHQGIYAGRVLNFFLSFVIVCLIIIPKRKGNYPILSVCGLLLYPYYLFSSIVLYTDIIAAFFVFFGFWFYIRNRHVYSSISFILAIASRQYMLAFPIAVAMFELTKSKKNKFKDSIRWIAPLFAAASILGWIWFFGGLVPPGIEAMQSPITDAQQNGIQIFGVWFFPTNGLYFLACIGLYFVIPEIILFRKLPQPVDLRNLITRKYGYIALVLLVLLLVYLPMPVSTHGILSKIMTALPGNFFRFILLYILIFLTCVRFIGFNLSSWVVIINCGILMTAYAWDKYALPVLIVLWYLKSLESMHPLTQTNSQTSTQTIDRVTMR